jgi:hypothetical protein
MLHDEQWDLRSRMETTGAAAATPEWRAGAGVADAVVPAGGSAVFAGSVMTGTGLTKEERY